MLVSHASDAAVTSTGESGTGKVPGLLEMLTLVPGPRKRRGRRYLLVFVLAVAVACALAGARNFREAGDHAADLPQEILARLGGRPHPLLRKIIAPSETRIRTLIHAVSAGLLDDLIGGWLRALADSGRLDEALTAIAVDGKWLRGVLDGQVKLFAAMLHEEKVIIAQHRIPDEATETTQVRELLDSADPAERGRYRRRGPRAAGNRAVHRRRAGIGLLPVRDGKPAIAAAGSLRRHPGNKARETRTTASWTVPMAGLSAAPSGSPMPEGSTSRTSAGSSGSAATATTPTAS